MKPFILIVLFFLNVNAVQNYICNTEYVISEGKKYLPPDNLKTININISDDRNQLVFKTQNGQSLYNYKSFIKPTETIPSIGVSFDNNEKFVDIFNNNLLYFGLVKGGHLIKAKCPSMNLSLREVSFTSDGNIVYGFPFSNTKKQSTPYSGEEKLYTSSARVAIFEINTSGNTNYYVKLKDAYSKKTVMTIFIHGGDSITTKVPLGSYEVVYASGKKWYGYKNLFGKKTAYNKTDQVFQFQRKYNQVNGYAITLYQVAGGNLRTLSLPKNQF